MYLNKNRGGQIEGTAVPANVLSGKTFMSANSDKLQTGTMPYQGTSVKAIMSGQNRLGVFYYIPEGYYEESNSRAWVYRPLSDFGNASASDVIKGKNFTSSTGLRITGTMPTALTPVVLAQTNGGGSVTTTEDYKAVVVEGAYMGTRSQYNLPSASFSNGAKSAKSASAGQWGYNSNYGHDANFQGALNVYLDIPKGTKISWGISNWGVINIIGLK